METKDLKNLKLISHILYGLIGIVTGIMSGLLWIATNVPTKHYVDQKHVEAMQYVDQNVKAFESRLDSGEETQKKLEKTLERIDDRVFKLLEMQKGR